MDNDICGIYKIQNKINNKIYIGKSIHIYQRWADHKIANDNSYFHNALNYYGVENFSWDIIEIVPAENLNQREQFWISYYDSIFPKGYNLTEGGDGGCPEFLKKPVRQYSLDGKFIKEYPSIQEAVRGMKIDHGNGIYQCCKNKQKSAYGFMWRYVENNTIEDIDPISPDKKGSNRIFVEQYDYNGKYITTYSSVLEAARALGNENFHRSISRCCNEERYITTGGYQWKFKNSNKIIGKVEPPKSNKKKQVQQYSKEGILLNTFSSSREASRETGVAQASISNTCLGKQRTGGGFIWKYI